MGISKAGAHLLLEEVYKRPARGTVLQLGRQHLFFTSEELAHMATEHGVHLLQPPAGNVLKPLLDDRHIDDGSFFSSLGFTTVESVDYSADESPTHVFDLNQLAPANLHGRYDLIYDGGTLEHVFDMRTSLRNIFEMLAVGGRVVHASPSSNHVDHGFYMFSPTLFYDYYTANGFIIHDIQLVVYTSDFNADPWKIYDYVPGMLDSLSFGGFDRGQMLAIFVSAEKTASSTWDRIPQQGAYARAWNDHQGEYDPGQPHRKLNAPWKPRNH